MSPAYEGKAGSNIGDAIAVRGYADASSFQCHCASRSHGACYFFLILCKILRYTFFIMIFIFVLVRLSPWVK